MEKTIYCIWHDTELIHRKDKKPSHVILVRGKWSDYQNIYRTSVKKFRYDKLEEAQEFAAWKLSQINKTK